MKYKLKVNFLGFPKGTKLKIYDIDDLYHLDYKIYFDEDWIKENMEIFEEVK